MSNIDPKNIADLHHVNGRWELTFFRPEMGAYRFDDLQNQRGILYAIKCERFCKIGMTTNLEKRFKQIEGGMPFEVSLVAKKTVQLISLAYCEAWVHKQFSDRRTKNEWFEVTAEEATAKLNEALRVSNAYARNCRIWFYKDRQRKANDPVYQAKAREEYAAFLRSIEKQKRASPDLRRYLDSA